MLEQLRQAIETLPPRDQEYLLEIVHDLQQQQFNGITKEPQESSDNSFHQNLTPRKKGSAKGKLIIHQEDQAHLEFFTDYRPQ